MDCQDGTVAKMDKPGGLGDSVTSQRPHHTEAAGAVERGGEIRIRGNRGMKLDTNWLVRSRRIPCVPLRLHKREMQPLERPTKCGRRNFSEKKGRLGGRANLSFLFAPARVRW